MTTQKSMLYLLIFIAGFLVVSFFSFYTVTHPQEINPPYTPEAFNLPAEDVSLTTSDGLSLAGWHIPSPDSPNRALLLLHGYPTNKSDMLSLANDLYPTFSLLLIDFRSFGESEGNATTLGINEQKDVSAALSFLEERYENIGVFGYSYGGTTALMHATNDTRIDAVASYGAFADLRTLGHEIYSSLWVLKYPLVELVNFYARIAYGDWASSVAPVHSTEDITAPVFIGHAAGDPLIPFSHAERLVTALSESENEITTYITPDTSHVGLPDDLSERLEIFFTQHLGN